MTGESRPALRATRPGEGLVGAPAFDAARDAVRDLRDAVDGISVTLSSMTPQPRPQAIRTDVDTDGTLVKVWMETPFMEVRSFPGTVAVSGGRRLEWAPNWTALSREDARKIAWALLAAADGAAS